MSLKLVKRGERYYIHGTVRGISVREATGTANRAAAEALRIKRENEILQRSIHGAATVATFEEAALNYVELGGEDYFIGKICDRIGKTKLKDINQDLIDRLALAMYPSVKPATRARCVHTPISAVMHHAAKRGLCQHLEIERPKASPVKERWLTPAEAERLIAACKPYMRPLVIFLFATGARIGEALSLDWREVDLARAHCHFLKTKNGQPRGVPLHPRVVAELRKLAPKESGPVFLSLSGKEFAKRGWDKSAPSGGNIKTAFDRACRIAGIADFTPHCCRHTWATWHYQANRDLQQLQRDGGWKTLAMVQRYAHLNSEQAAPSMAAALSHWDAPAKPALKVVGE